MKAENRIFLDANRPHYDMLMRAGILKHLDYSVRENLLRIVREEFAPNYLATLWCSPCIVELVKYSYGQYDKWLADNKDEVVITKHATFPKHDELDNG